MSLQKSFSGVRDWYNDLNGATLTGAIDVIVVEQEDCVLVSSPFHVRFGKLGLLKAKNKVVDIQVNGDSIADIHMKLDDNGTAFYLEGLEDGKLENSSANTTSPLKQLNLKKGVNEIQFSVTTAYQGTARCSCHVYLWNYMDKIVISDIDGTITKSDVRGHVLPIIGMDWAQSGVASLFTKIVNNGYHIVYLSARAIGQASVTKEYLSSIKQGDLNLPIGPIFLNPTSLANAFHREVIEKNPHEFKIACLSDIKKLFPETYNPFYAGYGNRVNDVWAYKTVGIPENMIFTINSKGELRDDLTSAFQTSYEEQSLDVDRLYPEILSSKITKKHATSDQSDEVRLSEAVGN